MEVEGPDLDTLANYLTSLSLSAPAIFVLLQIWDNFLVFFEKRAKV